MAAIGETNSHAMTGQSVKDTIEANDENLNKTAMTNQVKQTMTPKTQDNAKILPNDVATPLPPSKP